MVRKGRLPGTLVLLLALGASGALSQTRVDLGRQARLAAGTTLPAQCVAGQLFLKSDAVLGSSIYVCSTADTWSVVGGPFAPSNAAAPPAACAEGTLYLRNDASANIHQLYICSSPNVWTNAGAQSGTAAERPANCVAGQTWLATDTGELTYCSVPGSPGAWSLTLSGPTGPQGPPGPVGGGNGQLTYNAYGAPAGSSLSQNSDGSLSSAKAFNEQVCAVAFSTAPAFDAAACNRFELGTLTGSVASSVISNLKSGLHLKFVLKQDGAGGRAMAWPPGFLNMCQPWPAPDAVTVQEADVMADGVTVRGTGCTTDALASSLSSGYLSQTYPAGATAIAANTWVKLATGKLAPLAAGDSILGVAPFACPANATACEVAVAGQVSVLAEGAVTQDRLLTAGSTNPAAAADTGQTVATSLCLSTNVGGRATASAASGALVPVQLLVPGSRGARACGPDLSAANRSVRLGGYEVGSEHAAAPLSNSDLMNHAFFINDGFPKTLTQAHCISDAGSQAVTVAIGGTAIFSITCVPPATYSQAVTDGTTGYLLAASMTSTAVAAGAVLDMTGTANGTTRDVKLHLYGTVN